jgi:hypothetical protein
MEASSLTVTPGFWRIRLSASSPRVPPRLRLRRLVPPPLGVHSVEGRLRALELEVLLVKGTQLFEPLLYLGALLGKEVSHSTP